MYITVTHRAFRTRRKVCDQHGIDLDLRRKTIHHCDLDELLLLDDDKFHRHEKSWNHNLTHAIRLVKNGYNAKLENGNDEFSGRFKHCAEFNRNCRDRQI